MTAIRLCIDENLQGPALILIYSTIDILATLGRDKTHQYVERSDFLQWVETYLFPGSDLNCSAMDLYSARCGVLHSYSPASKRSDKRSVKVLIHILGNDGNTDFWKILENADPQRYLIVYVEKLFTALVNGIIKFRSTFADPTLLEKRSNEMSGDWSSNEFYRSLQKQKMGRP